MFYNKVKKSHKCELLERRNMVNKRKLKAVIVEKNLTQEWLANELNINRTTFSRKMSVDGKFTVEEANEIVRSLGLTKDEALAIFFADTFA